jgi:trehalose 6-phosphate phosphatase
MSTASTIETISRRICLRRPLFLVFDRDGTLVPFSDDPAAAVMSAQVRASLDRLSLKAGVHVAILSARAIRELRADLPDGNHILAGNYGLEIEGNSFGRSCHPQVASARSELALAKKLLEEKLRCDFQTILEDHELTLCLHFHKTPGALQEDFHSVVRQVEGTFPQLFFKKLPTSYEVWTVRNWNKADGLTRMLALSRMDPESITLLYAGDSQDDEPAFAWTNRHNGVSLLIGKRNSRAKFALATPFQLHELLSRLESM